MNIPIESASYSNSQFQYWHLKLLQSISQSLGGTLKIEITPSLSTSRYRQYVLTLLQDISNRTLGSAQGSLQEVTWDDVQNKPETFPPSPHRHHTSDIIDLSRTPIHGGYFPSAPSFPSQ